MPNCPILFDASCPNWPNPPVDSVQSMMPLGFRHPFVVSSLSVRLYVCCLIASTRLVSTLFNWTPIIHWLSDSHSCTHTKKRKKKKKRRLDLSFRLPGLIHSIGWPVNYRNGMLFMLNAAEWRSRRPETNGKNDDDDDCLMFISVYIYLARRWLIA